MNLFRSGTHVVRWSQYNPSSAEGTLPLGDWVTYFSAPRFRQRLDHDFFVKRASLRPTREEVLKAMGKSGVFWGL